MRPVTRTLTPLAVGLALAVGGTAIVTGPVAAATPGVVTKAEYRKIHKGMTGTRVVRLTGANGKLVRGSNASGSVLVAYRAPRGRHVCVK